MVEVVGGAGWCRVGEGGAVRRNGGGWEGLNSLRLCLPLVGICRPWCRRASSCVG